MKSDRWSLIEEIFQGALERPSAERKQYVETACENDKELLAEIESLLESDNDAERVLRSLIAGDLKEAAQASNLSETGLQLGPLSTGSRVRQRRDGRCLPGRPI